MADSLYYFPPPKKDNRVYSCNSVNKDAQTICALASGRGKAGVSVVRISGNEAKTALLRLSKQQTLPKPRTAKLQSIINPYNGEIIDKGIVLFFPAPNSFTGEDVCELQVHGSKAVVNLILKCLTRMDNIRLAEPGEFARRAVYNNKMDLTQIEGLADLIDAETEAQRKLAQQQADGINGELYESWRKQLISCIAHIQAYIDFSETDSIDTHLPKVYETVLQLKNNITELIKTYNAGVAIKEGAQVVIYGATNVGKSSIYNLLCQKNKAIVSEVSGTTRDLLETPFDIGGFKISLIDTAGLKKRTQDPIEGVGILKAIEVLKDPNTHLHILVCSLVPYVLYRRFFRNPSFFQYLKFYTASLGVKDLTNPSASNIKDFFKKRTVIVMNKIDKLFISANCLVINEEIRDHVIFVSCKMGKGHVGVLEQCDMELHSEFRESFAEGPNLSSLRQKQHLETCLMDLENFMQKFLEKGGQDAAILLQCLKHACVKLACITGKIQNEEVLDHIFKNFCVGK